MANIFRYTILVAALLLSTAYLCISVCGASNTVKAPWNAQSPPPQQVSMDAETLEALIEFQEIVTEGVPLIVNLFRKLTNNKFAKPLIDVLLTCDKQNFMESCVQGLFRKVVNILAGKHQVQTKTDNPNEAQSQNKTTKPPPIQSGSSSADPKTEL